MKAESDPSEAAVDPAAFNEHHKDPALSAEFDQLIYALMRRGAREYSTFEARWQRVQQGLAEDFKEYLKHSPGKDGTPHPRLRLHWALVFFRDTVNHNKYLIPTRSDYRGASFRQIEWATNRLNLLGYVDHIDMPSLTDRTTWSAPLKKARSGVEREIEEIEARSKTGPDSASKYSGKQHADAVADSELPRMAVRRESARDPTEDAAKPDAQDMPDPTLAANEPLVHSADARGGIALLLGRALKMFQVAPSVLVSWYGVECANGVMEEPVGVRLDLEVWNHDSRPIIVSKILIKFRNLTLDSVRSNPNYPWEWVMERRKLLRWSGRTVIAPDQRADFVARVPLLPPQPRYRYLLQEFRDHVAVDVDYVTLPRNRTKHAHLSLKFSWANGEPDGMGTF